MKSATRYGARVLLTAAILVLAGMPRAQKAGFTVRGFANTSFIWQDEGNSFGDMGLTPIFLWESDRLLVESELEIAASGSHDAELGLGYLTLNYDLSPKIRAQAGKLLLPFGIFGPRLHPSWINKLPTIPDGFGHEDLSPMSDFGAALRGVIPLGNFRWGYSAYVINGPQLAADSLEAGKILFGMVEDNNANKAVGGRLELVHLSQATWEIGLSGMFGDAGPDDLESMSLLGAVDFSYQRPSRFLHGVVDLKSQGNMVEVDRREYGFGTDFHNLSWNYVVQLAYRPTLANRQWVRDLEAVGRFTQLQYPHAAPWSKEGTEWAAGVNYWLGWNSLLKVAWVQSMLEEGDVGMADMPGMSGTSGPSSAHDENMDGKLVVQLAIGL